MEELAARKEKTTDALKPQIDEWLKEYQDEIDFYNNQIKKVVKSKDPSGISEEIDDVTGEKIGAKKYIVDGKEVSQGEFEAMQGKPIGTKSITYIEATGDDVQDVQLKGKEYKSEVISPDEYLKETGGYESTFIDQKKVDKIKEKIKNGTPLDPLTLTTKEGSNVGQEGRHRAEAAKQLGIKEIPVVRIEGELPNVKEEVKPTEVKKYNGIFSTDISSISNKGKGTKELLKPDDNRKVVMMSPDEYLTLVRNGIGNNIIDIMKVRLEQDKLLKQNLNNASNDVIEKEKQKMKGGVDENLNEVSRKAIQDAVKSGNKIDMPLFF